jgi:hypothetical protein
MGRGFWLVFGLSVFFGLGFAVGGAGIFGSPFAGVPSNWPSSPEVYLRNVLMLLTILVGPAACVAALLAHSLGVRAAASAFLVLGAIAGAILGCLTPFREVWEKVFLVLVWGPMIVVGLTPPTPASPRA